MTVLKGVSLFANVGVAEACLKDIGVDIVLANEIDETRAAFYSCLYPETEMIVGDITDDVIRAEIVEKSIEKEVDFLIATPPCQGMSEAGLRLEFDSRNQLIEYAIDVIEKVLPKFVLIENVPKQLTTKIKYRDKIMYIPDYVKSKLGEHYSFNKETLIKARDHGIPQLRERNIFLLVRKDMNIEWEFPEKQEEITLREAIGHLPSLDPILREGLDETIRKFPDFKTKAEKAREVSKWHYPPKHSWKQVEWMMHTPSGKSAIYNEKHYPRKDDGTPIKAHHNHYRRMKWDMPSRTITQNNGVISSLACVHPGREYTNDLGEIMYSDPRVLTIYEIMIVMSLPSDWPIPDWAKDNFIRKVIGEGIPSKLVKDILIELIKKI